MNHVVKHVRKIIILIVGTAVFILGLVLIPLPGPGILVCFAGLFILATEFEWAARHRDRTKDSFKKVLDKTKSSRTKK